MFTSTLSTRLKAKPKSSRPKPGSNEAQQDLWMAVAMQQHMLRQMNDAGRLAPELPRPAPLKEGQLSLAQKMGLVERPPDAPTDEAWSDLEVQSALRKDLSRPCAICCMPFDAPGEPQQQQQQQQQLKTNNNKNKKSNPAVILSCSHVFHAQCLQQLEKHARLSRVQKRCPVCRHQNYFRRQNASAPAILQANAVIKIQSLYRGHRARRVYLRMRMAKDPSFKEEYYYKKLKQITDMRMAEHAAHEQEVELALDDMDYAMQICSASGMTDAAWLELVTTARRARDGVLDCPVCLCAIEFASSQQQQPPSASQDSAASGNEITTLGAFVDNWEQQQGGGEPAQQHQRSIVATSCSHFYHSACLHSMERFMMGGCGGGGGDQQPKPRCACCRKGYLKRFVE